MLAIIVCLGGIFTILVTSEILYKQKILKGEYLRKFVHISSGSFIAFWPWLVSWRTIQVIGLTMFAVIWLNHRLRTLHVGGIVTRKTHGFYFFALAVFIIPLLTHHKIFFALALLNMALADGLAALVGITYGKKLSYKIFHQVKTLPGTMTFWFVSLCILGIGVLFAHDFISFSHYVVLLIFLPPILAILENLAVLGLDNVVVPMAVVIALRLAS